MFNKSITSLAKEEKNAFEVTINSERNFSVDEMAKIHAMSILISVYQLCLHRDSSTSAWVSRSQLLVILISQKFIPFS